MGISKGCMVPSTSCRLLIHSMVIGVGARKVSLRFWRTNLVTDLEHPDLLH